MSIKPLPTMKPMSAIHESHTTTFRKSQQAHDDQANRDSMAQVLRRHLCRKTSQGRQLDYRLQREEATCHTQDQASVPEMMKQVRHRVMLMQYKVTIKCRGKSRMPVRLVRDMQ